MTQRERRLTVILSAALVAGLVGFVGYQFVLSPLLEKDRQLKQREEEVTKLSDQVDVIREMKRGYEAARQQSLPADVGLSRTEYGDLLLGLCRRAELTGGLKILQAEPDNKSVPTLGSKKPAYTRLTYEVAAKGDLYQLVDFLRRFYEQPLLHQVKKMNVQRPSDARSQGRRELDISLTVEALVLDNAPPRPTLLPVVRELALVAGPAALTGYNMQATATGRGSPVPPAGVLAEPPRDYLAVTGKNMFFGPPPTTPTRPEAKPVADDDGSPFITLTSVVGHDDGTVVAVFRDKATNNDYTVTQTPKGAVTVLGEYELNGKRRTLKDYIGEKASNRIMYGTEEGQNRRMWRVRRVLLDAVVLEQVEVPAEGAKPKPPVLGFVGGGAGAVVAVPEGKMYKVGIGQGLAAMPEKPTTGPVKYLLTREAWKDVYARPLVPAAADSPEGQGR